MFKQRLMTACVLLLTTLGALFYCTPFLWMVLTSILAQALLWEFAQMIGMRSTQIKYYLVVSALLQWLLWVVNYSFGLIESIAILIFWFVVAPWWLIKRWKILPNWAGWSAGWFMVLPAWRALQILRPLQQMGGQLLILIGIVWVADTTAYIVGKWHGTHKLAESISPGKTWEGLIGGLLGVLFYSFLLHYWAYLPFGLSGWVAPFLATLLCIASVIGDLLESLLKRMAGIKDSGRLLPGHGGLFDRMDGFIAVMAVSLALLVIAERCLGYFGT